MLRQLVAVALILLAAVPAEAAPSGGQCPPDDPECYVFDDLPPGPPSGGTGGGSSSAGCTFNGATVPCRLDGLGSYVGNGCYVRQIPPPTPDPHAGAGGWYIRTCNVFNGDPVQYEAEWSATPPDAGPTPE
jgi:hypothetical protein